MRSGGIELLNCDCVAYMSGIDDKFFDLAIVDPPYGIGAGSSSFKSGTRKKSNFHKENDWDTNIPSAEYWEHLFRVSKNQIVWGGNYMTEYLKPSRGWIFWDKFTGENSYADGELAWTSFDTVLKKYDKYWSGAHAKEKNDVDRIHPTQKPISLYKWILKTYAKEGDRILDTHLGSGSIAIACHDYKFELTATEIDAEYFKETCKRFSNHVAQTVLF